MWLFFFASFFCCFFPPGFSGFINKKKRKKHISENSLDKWWILLINLFIYLILSLSLSSPPVTSTRTKERLKARSRSLMLFMKLMAALWVYFLLALWHRVFCQMPTAQQLTAWLFFLSHMMWNNLQESLPIYQELKCARHIKRRPKFKVLKFKVVISFMVLIVGIKCIWPVKIRISPCLSSSYLLSL